MLINIPILSKLAKLSLSTINSKNPYLHYLCAHISSKSTRANTLKLTNVLFLCLCKEIKKDSKESQKQRKKELTKNLQGPFTIKRTTGTKVGVFTKDCIFHMSCMDLFIKYQNCILNVISRTKYQYLAKHDPCYDKNNYYLHEDLDYNQMYAFVFNHDYKF